MSRLRSTRSRRRWRSPGWCGLPAWSPFPERPVSSNSVQRRRRRYQLSDDQPDALTAAAGRSDRCRLLEFVDTIRDKVGPLESLGVSALLSRPLGSASPLLDVRQFLDPIRLSALACRPTLRFAEHLRLGLGSLGRPSARPPESWPVPRAWTSSAAFVPLRRQFVGLLLGSGGPASQRLGFAARLRSSAAVLARLRPRVLSLRAPLSAPATASVTFGVQIGVGILLRLGRCRVELCRTAERSLRSASAEPRSSTPVAQGVADGRVQRSQRTLVEQSGRRFCLQPSDHPVLDHLKRQPGDLVLKTQNRERDFVTFIAISCVLPVLKAGRLRWSTARPGV